MSKTNNIYQANASQDSALVKEHFSIRTFNREYDMKLFILQAAKVRSLQKRYYSTQDKTLKQSLLIQCKQEELRLDALGNTLWTKYKLGELGQHRPGR